jgi:galactokinase
MNLEKIVRTFYSIYEEEPLVARSPGRVNIIGEHTDYNEGFVLPAAIDKAIWVAVSKRSDQYMELFASNLEDSFSSSTSMLKKSGKIWPNYILGIVDQLIRNGYHVGGFNLVIDGDVPVGAGLSSSAALECATIYALNNLFDFGIDAMTMVKMAQRAEHSFAGVNCGIMDQFASMFGKKDQAIKLDCRSLQYEYVPVKLNGYKIVLLDTNVKHSLAATEYNKRTQECEEGLSWIKECHPQVKSLRDVSLEMLKENVLPKDEIIFKRCKYVVDENMRLLRGCADLESGDLNALGKKMFQTHDGLSKEYEVSCPELDFLVNGVKGEHDVLGSRMMGGGFGGCTINLVKEESVDKIIEEAYRQYKKVVGLELTAYTAQIENGTEILKQNIHV